MMMTFVVMGHSPWMGNFFYSGNCSCVCVCVCGGFVTVSSTVRLRLLADTPLISGSIPHSKRICIASSGLCTVNWPNRKKEWTLKWVPSCFSFLNSSGHPVIHLVYIEHILCAWFWAKHWLYKHKTWALPSRISELGMGNRVVKR